MKDLPHHMKKLNRRVIRSLHREGQAEEEFMLTSEPFEETERQKKKQAKQRAKEEHLAHTPHPLTSEEKNRKMRQRVPIFDRNSAKPKRAKATKKKRPRI